MRKIIDIPDEIIEDLKLISKKDKRPLKNFIENNLVELVKKEKKTVKNLKTKNDGKD